jgi:hypothetical protein
MGAISSLVRQRAGYAHSFMGYAHSFMGYAHSFMGYAHSFMGAAADAIPGRFSPFDSQRVPNDVRGAVTSPSPFPVRPTRSRRPDGSGYAGSGRAASDRGGLDTLTRIEASATKPRTGAETNQTGHPFVRSGRPCRAAREEPSHDQGDPDRDREGAHEGRADDRARRARAARAQGRHLPLRDERVTYFLAGDATYTEGNLRAEKADGVTFDPALSVATLRAIKAFAAGEPTIVLPAHDPDGPARLAAGRFYA